MQTHTSTCSSGNFASSEFHTRGKPNLLSLVDDPFCVNSEESVYSEDKLYQVVKL